MTADELRLLRAQHAAEIRRLRSEFVRGGIIRAIPPEVKLVGLHFHGLATELRRRIDWHGPAWCGLEKVPDVETISSVVQQLRVEQLKPEFVCDLAPLKPERMRHLLRHSSVLSST